MLAGALFPRRVRGSAVPPFATALARGAFSALLPLCLLWTAVSQDNRSLADQLLLRTSVVYDWHPVPSPAQIGGHGGRLVTEKI